MADVVVVAKVQCIKANCSPAWGFILTNFGGSAPNVVNFYIQRGTTEHWIKEGKIAVRWTRLSCYGFDANQVHLQLHVLVDNLAITRRIRNSFSPL